MKIEKHIYRLCADSISSLDSSLLRDIYAFSFWMYNAEDDPRRPVVSISYNTIDHFKSQIFNASSVNEAKWNFAFWAQNEIIEIGYQQDPIWDRLKSEWLSKLSLDYSDEDEESEFDLCFKKGKAIFKEFSVCLVSVVRALHENRITAFPIIIHSLQYDKHIQELNIKANDLDCVQEFVDWIEWMKL